MLCDFQPFGRSYANPSVKQLRTFLPTTLQMGLSISEITADLLRMYAPLAINVAHLPVQRLSSEKWTKT